MTQQLHDDRAQALRALLVELPAETRTAKAWGSDAVKRSLLITAAVGVAASATVLAVQFAPSSQPDALPPATSGDPGTVSGGGSASRVKMYASLDELIADSGAVVVGTVRAQDQGPDGTTVSSIVVERSFSPAGLGSTSLEPPVTVADGATVRVRTFQSAVTSLPSAPLTQGSSYLLFLSPTGLPDAGDDEFFVTGVVAGIYSADGDRYLRASQDGDRLPPELTPEDLAR